MLRKPRERARPPTRGLDLCENAQASAQHVPGRVLVAVQRKDAHAAPVDSLREPLRNSGSSARTVLRRAGRGNFDEGNAGTCISECRRTLPNPAQRWPGSGLACSCPCESCCGSAALQPRRSRSSSKSGRRGDGVPAVPTPPAFPMPAEAPPSSCRGSSNLACCATPRAASGGLRFAPQASAGAPHVRHRKGWQSSGCPHPAPEGVPARPCGLPADAERTQTTPESHWKMRFTDVSALRKWASCALSVGCRIAGTTRPAGTVPERPFPRTMVPWSWRHARQSGLRFNCDPC